MKHIIYTTIFLCFCYNGLAQTKPSGVPGQFSTNWQRWGYAQSDSGTIIAKRDTNWLPRFNGSMVFRPQDIRPYFYDSTALRWYKIWSETDTNTVLATQYDLTQLPQTTLSNIGTGVRWVATGNGQIKTVSSSNTIIWDSISIPNTLTGKADTSVLSTQFDISTKLNMPTIFGTLYNNNSWPILTTDWTNSGTTVNIVSNKLEVSGGNQSISATVGTNNSVFNQYLRLFPGYGYSMLEKVKMVAKIRLNSVPSGSTTGFAIGKISTNTIGLPSNSMCYFNTSTGTGGGKAFLLTGGLNMTTAATATSLPLNQNDYYLLTWERNLDQVTVTVKNLTVDTAIINIIYNYDFTAMSNSLADNVGTYGVASLGGSFTIDSVSITSNEIKNANLMLIGDSKFAGYTSIFDLRIGSQLNRYYHGTVVKGGQSDISADFINTLPECVAMTPRTAILEVGRNDIYAGVPVSTYGPNIDTIVARLQAAGTTVYLVDALYETSLNQDVLKGYINSKYGASGTIIPNRVIHTYQIGTQSGTLAADNVHPSTFGNQVYTNAIINTLPLPNYGQNLNDVDNSPRRVQSFDSLYLLGTLRIVGQRGITYFMPNEYVSGDIILQRDNGIVASNVSLSTFKNRITLLNSTNGGMDLRNYQPGSNITFYTVGSGGVGTQTAALSIPANGALRTSNAAAGFSSTFGDIYIPIGKSLASAGNTVEGFENKITIYNSSTADMEFRGYTNTSDFRWFVSDSTIGNQRNAMTLRNSNGYLGLRYTTPAYTLHVNGTIGANKDSIPHISAIATNEILTIDTTTGQFKRILPSDLFGNTLYTGDGTANNRTVTVTGNDLIFTSTLTGLDATMTINNTSSGYGLYVNSSGVGTGIDVGSSTGYGGNIHSTSGPGLQVSTGGNTGLIINTDPSSTNTIHQSVDIIRTSSGTPANDIGLSIDLDVETSAQVRNANQIVSKWTNVTDASRTSQFEIYGVNNATSARKLALAGTGQLILDGYGTGTFSGAPVYLVGVNASGNLVEAGMRNAQSGTTYTVLATDALKIIGLSNTAARTITLPAATAFPSGVTVWFKDEAGTAGTGNIMINRAGSDTIDGATSYTISSNYGFIGLYSNGSNAWFVR